MNKFFMHDAAGKIHTVCGRESDLLPMPRDGFVFRPWKPMEPVEPPTPSSVAYWTDEGPVWVETASVEELRILKNSEINGARAEANRTYFDFQGKQVACDDLSWKDIISANAEIALTSQMPDAWPGGWKTMDNSYVAIPDVATWTLFIKAMVNRGTTHFQRAQQLKSLLAAAETPEQIAAIKWETQIG